VRAQTPGVILKGVAFSVAFRVSSRWLPWNKQYYLSIKLMSTVACCTSSGADD
jgi:hypothetical protein